MQKTVLYHVHGGPKYHEQTRYSILTLLALLIEQKRNDVSIVVYTDRPNQLPAHELVKAVQVSPEQFAGWRGPLDFVHRIKLEVLRTAVREIGPPLIYVDSDTRWIHIPDEAFSALSAADARPACYMHKVEGLITASHFPQYYPLLRKERHKLREWGIPPDMPWTMWNAGTVGIPVRSEGFIDDALHMTDTLLPRASRDWVEQLALSLVAASRFDVRPFDACLEHWWPYGSELPVYLRRFFDALPPGLPVAEQAARAAQFPIVESELRAIQRRPANRFARWRGKLRNSFYKRRVDLMAFALRRRAAVRSVD